VLYTTTLVLTSILLAAGGAVQSGDVWQTLHGSWSGSGQVRGMSAEVELTFAPALGDDGRAHRLEFVNRMQLPDGKPWMFRAQAIYQCGADGHCRGHWYDNRGQSMPVDARIEGRALIVDWGDAGTPERGRTEYRVQSDGAMEIVDHVLGKDGAWKQFGLVKAVRAQRSR